MAKRIERRTGNMSKKNPSAAARKAWKTRRDRARKASQAAVKAWETRRKNAA